jgi:hypothetical protein
MRFVRAHSHRGQGCFSDSLAQTVPPAVDAGFEAPLTRFEPDMLTAGRISVDPYAAWLERRDHERGPQQAEIRWV